MREELKQGKEQRVCFIHILLTRRDYLNRYLVSVQDYHSGGVLIEV